MIKVLVADDQRLMREGLSALIEVENEIAVVGTAVNGREAFERALELRPDVVLMDIRMPVADGIEGTRLIRSQLPETNVLMLTTFDDSELIFRALEEGASGYLLKDFPAETIVSAIRTVYGGGMVLPPKITAELLQEMKKAKEPSQPEAKRNDRQAKLAETLTERELDVLSLLGAGLNNREIAEKLFLTEGTVKNYVSSIMSKMELRDRTQAALFAVRYGYSPLDI